MFPISDDNPRIRTPIVTWCLIGTCVLVFLWQVSLGDERGQIAIFQFGMIPARLFGTGELRSDIAAVPAWSTLLTSMFMHGSWIHLGLNMLFLWIFGDNVEDSMGHLRYAIFYLVCGLAASFAHIAFGPGSAIPAVGASGAISGVLGGYLVLFPNNRVRVLTRGGVAHVPALVVLGFWIVIQLVNGIGSIASTSETGGVAYMAHIGGFVAGLALVKLMASERRPAYA
jgi:membrane associated rhomboid family serine protease